MIFAIFQISVLLHVVVVQKLEMLMQYRDRKAIFADFELIVVTARQYARLIAARCALYSSQM